MNTETLINTGKKEAQSSKAINLKALTTGKKDDRASCASGVCEVAWKPPFAKSGKNTSSKKNR